MTNYLITIMDWGMGHASRCVPLIRDLVSQGHQVSVGSAGAALRLLEKECPGITLFVLPAYRIKYRFGSMPLNAVTQLLPALQTIRREHKFIRKIVEEHAIDCIISDGRFGCHHPDVKNIWLAHQLHIQYQIPAIQLMLNKLYHQYIRNRFSEIWIPDYEGSKSLAGVLSEPIPGLKHLFLGPLSRFKSLPNTKTKYDWIVLLSGPEPQRSKLEKELRLQLKSHKSLIIRGVPGSTTIKPVNDCLDVVDWLHGSDLTKQIEQTNRIICRSGYSTIMDLYFWQKNALFIPTPGQTEQVYLAKFHSGKRQAIYQKQGEVDIELALRMWEDVFGPRGGRI